MAKVIAIGSKLHIGHLIYFSHDYLSPTTTSVVLFVVV